MQELGMQGLEPGLRFLQCGVGFGGRGDVAGDHRRPDEPARHVEYRRDSQRYVKSRPVVMAAQRLVMIDAVASLDSAENAMHVAAAGRDVQARDGLSDHFGRGVAEDALGRPVPACHDAVQVRADDGVVRRLDDSGQGLKPMLAVPQRRFRRLAFGDVDDGRKNHGPIVGFDRVQSDLDRELASVFPQGVKIAPDPHRPRLRIGEETTARKPG